MSKMFPVIAATAVAISSTFSSAYPVGAAPLYSTSAPHADPVLQQVQYDGHWRRRPDYDYRFIRRGDAYYLNGHRGYRHHRPGYRRYNDWWFPAGAFIAGAIIGSAINQPPPPPRYYVRPGNGNAHVRWCYDRYRSYRASDNTFQPYSGPRRQCASPYG